MIAGALAESNGDMILRLRPISVAALALVPLLAACGGGSSAPPPAPDEALFREAVALWNAANAAAATQRALLAPPAPDPAAAQVQFDLALGLYAQAQARFDELGVRYPSSPRADNAAYLGGRCSYESGALFPAPLTPPAGPTEAAFFEDAVVRLDAMRARFPGSVLVDQACYFDGRAHFRLAPGSATPEAEYDAARADFAASLAADAAGTFADNAQYYVGRTGYELARLASAAWKALDPAATPPADLAAARQLAVDRFASARIELSKVPTQYPLSSYVDNARYYLGRASYDAPEPRDLAAAVDAFTAVVNDPASPYRPDALYYRGRSRFAQARPPAPAAPPADAAQLLQGALDDFQLVVTEAPASSVADGALFWSGRCRYELLLLPAALADFDAVEAWPGTHAYPLNSQWVDNALLYEVRVRVDQASDVTLCALACPPLSELGSHFPGTSPHTEACAYFAASPVCVSAARCAACP